MVFLVEDFVNLPSDQIANIWLAAHTQKLAKKDIKKTKLGEACDQLHSDKTKKPMQLRHYAQCLMGIAWIHCEQVKILHSVCTEAFSKARLILVRKRKVDLDPAQERGRDITLPENRNNANASNLLLQAEQAHDLMHDIDLNDTNYSQLLLRTDDNISDTASLLDSHSGRGEHLALDHEITMQQNDYTSPSRTRAGRAAVTDRRSSFGGISSLLESGEYDLEIKFDDDDDNEEPLDESKAQRSQDNADHVAFDDDETDDENRSVERGRGAATTTNNNTALFNTTHDHISDIGSVGAEHRIDLDDTHSRVSLEKEKQLDDLGSVHSAGSLPQNVPVIDAHAMEIDDHSIDDQQPLQVHFNLDAQSVTGSVSTAVLDGKQPEEEQATPPPSPGAAAQGTRSQRGGRVDGESEHGQDGEAERQKKRKKKDKKKKKRKKKFNVDKTIEFKGKELRETDPDRFEFVYNGGRDPVHIWREFPLSSLPFDDLLYQPLAKEHFGKFSRDICQRFHDCNKQKGKAKDMGSDQHAENSDELADINILRDSADEIEQGRDDANLLEAANMMNDLALPMNDIPLQPDEALVNAEQQQQISMLDEAGGARIDDDNASTLDSLVDDNIPPPADPVFDQDAMLRAPAVEQAAHDKEEDDDEDIDLSGKENVDDSNRLSFEEGDHEEMTQMQVPAQENAGKDGENNNLKLRDWSRRTKKTFIYLKGKQEKELSFNELVKSGTTKRETVVGVFYELLVFKNSDLVDLQQDEPYGDITITKTDNFYRHARVSQLWARRLSQQ